MSITHTLLAAVLVLGAACSASGPDDGTSDGLDQGPGGDDLDQGPGPGTGDDTGTPTPPTPPPTSACWDMMAQIDSCTGENICIDSGCVPAFGRDYTLSVTLAIAPLHLGSYWDVPPGSDPDAVVDLSMNGDVIIEEYAAWNTVAPTFSESAKKKLDATTTLLVDAWDNDTTSYADPIISCTKPLTAELLRARKFSCASDGSTVTVNLTP